MLAFCTFSHYHLSVYQVSFVYLQYFRDMLQTNLLLQKLGREITVITCERVMVLAFCTSSDDLLPMYQVLFSFLLHFQRYAPDKLSTAKIRKGSNSIDTGDRVMILAFWNSPHGPLTVYQVPFNYLQYF